jgi:integrase
MGAKTLKNAIDLWLDEQIPTTRGSYEYVMRDVVQFIGANIALAKVSPEKLVLYLQDVRKRPSVKSPATVNKYTKTIKTFFNWCIKMHYLKISPAKVLRYERTNKQIRRSKAMTDRELEKLLDYVKWKPRDNAVVRFLADTGCRARGAANLTIHDLDLESRSAIVTEKGDETRTVWFGDECAQALQEWLDYRANWLAETDNVLEGPYVFDFYGKSYKKNSQIGQIVRRACLKVGLRSLGSHSLRHRKGHQFADAGIAPSVAAQALGHKKATITLEFYYPSDTERAEAAIRQLATKNTLDDEALPESLKVDKTLTDSKTIDFRKASGGD